ncbi:glycine--tRNA ligase subunit beta [Aurantivibrio infirmus]
MAKDFLVEIGCEELPPKALKTLAQAFAKGIQDGLTANDLSFDSLRWFATPRRLSVLVTDLIEQGPDKEIEIHGPPPAAAKDKNGAWTKAAAGFAAKNNISPDQLLQLDTPKGPRLGIKENVSGKKATECLAKIVEDAVSTLPIPKRMRWGSSRTEFIRPVHWLVLLFGSEIINAKILGIESGNRTRGHRFHCDTRLEVTQPSAYERLLAEEAHVIADFDKRQAMIREQVESQGKALGGRAVIEDDLLNEVTALVEWPVALTGSFDKDFLSIPREALVSSMAEHQKYFHVVNEKDELLANFITVSNIESSDPAQVVDGNERVIRPRLSDAAFFFETDKKTSLAARVEKLRTVVFQTKLGTVYDKSVRIQKLAGYIATQLNGDVEHAERAGLLAKADLVSDMVLEFDKMQGIAGGYYALNDGEAKEVAEAIQEQYLPKFAGDSLPTSLAGSAVSLADRIDTLVGIFGIGQAPTGSKDPFALRRASLAALRILVEKELSLDLLPLLEQAKVNYSAVSEISNSDGDKIVQQVLAYMIERFRAWYEEHDIPVQVFLAVSARNITAPLDFDQRIKAVHAFNQLPESAALAAANKRVANILAKQDGQIVTSINEGLFVEAAETKLAKLIGEKQNEVKPLFAASKYTEGLSALASLRESVDAFFDNVMVMADDEALKNNRLALLAQLRALFLEVADISYLVPEKK